MKVDIRELVKKLPYDKNVWTYEQSQDERYRFLLGRKNEKAKKILLCCGVNPSTASPNDLDPTMRRVQAFAEQKGYDGYMMINLYPIRATDPNDIPDQIDEMAAEANLHYLEGWLKEAEGEIHIWAAWGNLIEKKPYLKDCLRQISLLTKKYDCSWYHMGGLTKRKHPRHPLYLSREAQMGAFDIEQYILELEDRRRDFAPHKTALCLDA